MKIDNTFKPTTGIGPTKANTPPSPPAAQMQEAVRLSSLAATHQAGEQPPIDSTRIQKIKQAISEGRFEINPEVIADRLIESARELINNSPKRQA